MSGEGGGKGNMCFRGFMGFHRVCRAWSHLQSMAVDDSWPDDTASIRGLLQQIRAIVVPMEGEWLMLSWTRQLGLSACFGGTCGCRLTYGCGLPVTLNPS